MLLVTPGSFDNHLGTLALFPQTKKLIVNHNKRNKYFEQPSKRAETTDVYRL